MINKKLFPALLIIVFLSFSAIGANGQPVPLTKSYQADRYDVTLSVQPDGALMVTETIVLQFNGGPFTYFFRELKYNELDEIDRLQASLDGQGLTQGTQPGQVEIDMRRPIKVTWHLDPASDTAHKFSLSYRVQGAIRQNKDSDTLIWRAISHEREYTIAHSTIHVEYPTGITPLNTPTLDGVAAEFEAGSRAVVFTTQEQIHEEMAVDVTVNFAAGSLITQPPAWQAAKEQENRQIAIALPFGLGAAALTGILGLLSVILGGQRFRRQMDTTTNQSYHTPPRDIPPALAAHLTGSSTAFVGTLFDLARRGVLRIEEGPKHWGSRTFDVIRLPSTEHLAPHEQTFMEIFFHKPKEDRVALSEIASFAHHGRFGQVVDQELVAAGWRDTDRSSQRNRFLALAGLGLLLSSGVFLAGFLLAIIISNTQASILGALMMGAAVGISGASVIGLLVAASISTLSDAGAQQADAWNSFTGYLRNITRGRETATPALFERYLPYAAGFGIATEWAKFFQKVTGVPVPAWFQGLQGGMDDGSCIAIMVAITAADSSVASASGADGGASGGGASGAG